MLIRPAMLQDIDEIFDIAMVQGARYPLKPDREKIIHQINLAISSAMHLCLVVVAEGKVRGALVAQAGQNLWAQRQFAVVNLWYSEIPGTGAQLLRQFKAWAIARPVIRVAGLSPDLETDPRIWKLAQRIGFKQHGGAYLLYTRGMRHGLT